jgi:glycosyltransferase involved in cell wall biosynthesis
MTLPKASVITPNYNHAKYLPKRIESILGQTFADFELIILDDASTDNSHEVIEAYAGDPRVTTIFNDRNSGSTFRQWRLGLSLARGDYIWFAESDDFADPRLLETLVDRLDRNPNVGLAVCQSWVVDQDDHIIHNYECEQNIYNDVIRHHENYDPGHWERDYTRNGREECLVYLYHLNTIPNASAVLFRRSALDRSGGAPRDMVISGDWYVYVRTLLVSDIAFVSTPLNYFRRHQGTVRSRTSRGTIAIREGRVIQRLLADRLGETELRQKYHESTPGFVGRVVNAARRPPHNKVPPRDALNLLIWFARFDNRAFQIALPMLAKEQAAEIGRKMGILGAMRKMKRAIFSGKGT